MSKLPPLPDAYTMSGEHDVYTADQLRERDRQIVEMCARIAVIHSQYPITTDFDRGYDKARKDVAERIRALLEERTPRGSLSESFAKFLREHKGYTEEQIAAECAANGLAAPQKGSA